MNKKLRVILAIVLCLIMVFTLVACTGDPGKDGKDGKDGIDGIDGENGVDGKDGKDGKDYELPKTEPYAAKELDYYASAYGVESGHVFQTITQMDLQAMLGVVVAATGAYVDEWTGNWVGAVSGKFAVLWGGAWDSYTVAMMQYVNQSAKAAGIDKVYVLDTTYDSNLSEQIVGRQMTGPNAGKIGYYNNGVFFDYSSLDISVLGTNPSTGAGTSYLSAIIALINSAEPNINAATVLKTASGKATTGLLMALDIPAVTGADLVDNKRPAEKMPKIAKYYVNSSITSASDFASAATAKTAVDAVFAEIGTNEGDFDIFELRSDRTGLAMKDYTNDLFQVINFGELITLLETPGDHFVYFATFGCGNAQAINRPIYESAKAAGYTGKIYVFDPSPSNSTGYVIRSNETALGTNRPIAALYAYLLDTYFTGFNSQWNMDNGHLAAATDLSKNNNTQYSIRGGTYTKMCFPALMLYNKDVTSNFVNGIVDIHETELTTTRTVQPTHVETIFAYRHLGLLFEKYGVAEALLTEGYSVESIRSGSNGAETNTNGLNLTIVAKKDNEYLGITYMFFEDNDAVDIYINLVANADRKAIVTAYKTNNQTNAFILTSLGDRANVGGNAIYYGSAAAVTFAKSILPAAPVAE